MFHDHHIGNNIIELESVGSTNDYALQLIQQGKAESGTLIRAEKQTHGKGQRGKTWESKKGENLLLSLVLKPHSLELSDYFHLNRCISLAVYEFIQRHIVQPVKIKWPNDIMVGDKKIAGILVENIIRQKQIAWSVIGIGINVNQTEFGDISPVPVSMQICRNKSFDLTEITLVLCELLEKWFLLLKLGQTGRIRDKYHELLFGLNEKRRFMDSEGKLDGTIIGTTNDGRLILTDEHGEKRYYSNQQLTWVI